MTAVVPMDARTFGENMRRERWEKRQIPQEVLAQRMGLKRQAQVSRWETSPDVPSPDTIERIAKAIGCTTADLMLGVVTPYDLLRGGIALPQKLIKEAPHLRPGQRSAKGTKRTA